MHIGIPPKIPSGCHHSALFDDRFVVLSRRARTRRRISLQRFLAESHIRVSLLGRTRDPIDLALAELGHERHIALTVPYFSVVPFAVHETGLLATMSLRLAAAYARRVPIDLSEPPLPLHTYSVRMIWHRRTESDPAAQFFRDLVRDVMRVALPDL